MSQPQQLGIQASSATYTTAHNSVDPQPTEARDGTHVLMDTSWIHFHYATVGTPKMVILFNLLFLLLFPKDTSFFLPLF